MNDLYFGRTYDEVFEDSWKKFTKGMEDHSFNHYNNSLGMWIYSKAQLKYEMKKRRMFPMEVCERLAEEWDSKQEKKSQHSISDKALNIIKAIKLTADSHGNIKLGDRAINALIEMGAIQRQQEFRGVEGGWN